MKVHKSNILKNNTIFLIEKESVLYTQPSIKCWAEYIQILYTILYYTTTTAGQPGILSF